MKAFYCDHFEIPVPEGHRFPLSKYAQLRQKIEKAQMDQVELCEAPAVTRDQLSKVHHESYIARVFNGELAREEVRELGFPWSKELVERCLRSSGGTVAAVKEALHCGIGVNLAGGTHHAGRESCQGFCVFNDSAVAARELLDVHQLQRILICDLDVHQGNGTAEIFAEEGRVFTFSMHGKNNFPLRKVASDLDVELHDGIEDHAYLELLHHHLRTSIETFHPDFLIYVAGADPYKHDRYGRLGLTKLGLKERDAAVLQMCQSYDIPLSVSMAGGYAEDVRDIVDIHFQTVSLAAAF